MLVFLDWFDSLVLLSFLGLGLSVWEPFGLGCGLFIFSFHLLFGTLCILRVYLVRLSLCF